MRERARQGFTRCIGSTPDGVWSAPGRVNLIGEHTDYNGGFALPMGIQLRTWAAAALRPDRRIRVASAAPGDGSARDQAAARSELPVVEVALDDLSRSLTGADDDSIAPWARYPLGVAAAMLEMAGAGRDVPGVDLFFESNVPFGAGLSSSAAIECAAALALNELWNLDLSRVQLAQAGQRAENEAVGAPTGLMDQLASMLAEPNTALLLDCRDVRVQPVALDLDSHGLELIIIDTRVRHSHAAGGYRDRRAACEQAARTLGVPLLRDASLEQLDARAHDLGPILLRRAAHVVSENERVLETVRLLRGGDVRSIGELLTASHVSLRDDFEVSVPELDLAVTTALESGALGARMTGGGFGGAAIALIDREGAEHLSARVTLAFEGAGFRAPTLLRAQPSAGAQRDE